MDGPWTQYQPQGVTPTPASEAGPWTQYQQSAAAPTTHQSGPWDNYAAPQVQHVPGLAPGYDKVVTSNQPTPKPQPQSGWDKFTHGQADPQHPNMWNVVYGLTGAYNDAIGHGLLMQPVRAAMEASGYGMDKVKQLYPNATPEQQKQILHAHYNQAVDNYRQQSEQQVKDNPYFGQPVGNFAAGVVGQPEQLLIGAPGAEAIGGKLAGKVVSKGLTGMAARAGAHVVGNAAVMAPVSAVSDAAAQVMDMAEGQKKDFDVTQSLRAAQGGALVGGLLGGVHAAAAEPVVSDFVKGLFKNRGRDTTPNVTPLGDTSPTTGNSLTLSDNDKAYLKQLQQHGTVDDIKQFLATKQGPKPTWQQVNQMVEQRDAMPEAMAGRDKFKQAFDDTIGEHQRQLVEDHVNAQTANWKRKPDIEVVRRPEDIADPAMRQHALDNGADESHLGIYSPDGKVRLFSDAIDNPELANSVLYHESLGHHGLAQLFGTRLNGILNTFIDRNLGGFKKDFEARQAANPGESRELSAEEVLAKMSQDGPLKPVLKDAIMHNLRQFGRRMGINFGYSDNEIQHILSMAHDSVINGTDGARANGFRGAKPAASAPNSRWLNLGGEAPEAKFMMTGPKAKGFRSDHPTAFTPSDGITRNEISDRNATLHPGMEEGNTYKLGDVLHHPQLYEQYPHLKDMPLHYRDMDAEGLHGGYDERDGSIHLNSKSDPSIARSTVLHEVQHAIQDHENYPGFAEAGAKEMTPEEYENNPLEKEAYETEARKNMTYGQRVSQAPAKFMRRESLSEEQTRDFTKLAEGQRDEPERAMVRAQRDVSKYPSGNTYGTLLEHVGDLTHRMSERSARQDPNFGQEFVEPKVRRAVNALDNIIDRDRLNAGKPWQEQSVKEYADAHEKLPVYNHVQRLARDAAVKLGRGDLDGSQRALQQLKDIIDSGRYPQEAAKYTGAKFMTRAQLASTPGRMSSRLEDIYKSLEENYDPAEHTKSWAEQQRDALSLGFPVSQIKKLRSANGLSLMVYRAGSAAKMLDDRITALEADLGTSRWNMDKNAEYLQAIADSHYLNARFRGDVSEAARTLQVAKAFPSLNLSTMKEIGEALREQGSGMAGLAEDSARFMKFAEKIKEMRVNGNKAGAAVKLQNVNKPYWEQYFNTFHFNAMLSSLATQVKAPIDMGTGVMRNVLEKFVAMPVGWTRQTIEAMTGKPVQPGVTSNELAMHMYGLIRPFLDLESVRQTGNSLKSGEGGYTLPDGTRVKTNLANSYGSTTNPDIPIVSLPSHLISAHDTFFRSHEMMGQMYALGARMAAEDMGKAAWDKLSWDDKNQIASNNARSPDVQIVHTAKAEGSYQDLIENASKEEAAKYQKISKYLEEAKDLTNRTLLLNSNPINKLLDKYRVYRPGMSIGDRMVTGFVSNIAPFIRVESNSLFNRVIQRSPLAIFDPYTQAQFRAGGAKADIALAKIIYGSVSLGMAWNAADTAKNYLTGKGPENANKRKELEASNWTPQSVHENGRFNQADSLAMSLFPWDQHNAVATQVAGIREAMEKGANPGQAGTAFKLAAATTFHDLANMTWASDIAPYEEAATTQGTPGLVRMAQAAGAQAGSWAPNILNYSQRLADPSMKDTRPDDPTDITGSMVNAFTSRLGPLNPNGFPNRASVYGDDTPNGQSVTGVHTWLSHGNGRAEITDPTEKELQRLSNDPSLKGHALITPVNTFVDVDDASKFDPKRVTKQDDDTNRVKLTRKQFEDYQRLAGQKTVQAVRELMRSNFWSQLSDEDRIAEIQSIMDEQKDNAKRELYGE